MDSTPENVMAVLRFDLVETRDALAASHAHAEAQAERIVALQDQLTAEHDFCAADQDRATAQLQALGRDLGRAHQEYRQVVADHAALAGMLESSERECEKYRLEIIRLKALLWDQARVGANGHAKPWNEGSAT